MSTDVSPLGPINPVSIPNAEEEKAAPWIVRKLVGVSQYRLGRLMVEATTLQCLIKFSG